MKKNLNIIKNGVIVTDDIKNCELKITGFFEEVINLNWNHCSGLALVSDNIIMAPNHIQIKPFPNDLKIEEDKIIIKNYKLIFGENFTLDLSKGNRWSGKINDYNLPILNKKDTVFISKYLSNYLNNYLDKKGLLKIICYWPEIFLENKKKNLKNNNLIYKKINNVLYDFWKEKKIEILKPLIGLGIGLTPSGDDFLVGLLSVFYYFQLTNLFNVNYLNENKYLKNTTAISAVALKSALSGYFNESIIDFYVNLKKDKVDFVLNKIKNIGSSSGVDMLSGIYFGFLFIIYNDFKNIY